MRNKLFIPIKNIFLELPSTYCTIEFYSQRKNVEIRSKAKTKIIEKSDNPEWDERFELLVAYKLEKSNNH